MRLLYTLSILLYGLGIRVASLFDHKAAQWIRGRKGLLDRLSKFRALHPQPVIWFHCASLGEFEQGRPAIEKIRTRYPGHQVLLTFYSPSGYEIRKNYTLAGHVTYLPLDTPRNMRKFIHVVRPDVVFFIKYEFWYNCLYILRKEHIPVFLISAIFRPQQVFFRWYGSWFRDHLKHFTRIFVQNESSLDLLGRIRVENAQKSGDTRFDRVAVLASGTRRFPLIERFASGRKVIIAGSTWPEDEAILYHLMDECGEDLLFVIAPHEVHPERIQRLIQRPGRPAVTYSSLEAGIQAGGNILVIDTIGMLAYLYRYATVVYIGGGFGKGIHNILEAATFGKPVLFGPNYQRFQEAVDLIRLGGAASISSAGELTSAVFTLMADPLKYQAAADAAAGYVDARKGAADRILDTVQTLFNP